MVRSRRGLLAGAAGSIVAVTIFACTGEAPPPGGADDGGGGAEGGGAVDAGVDADPVDAPSADASDSNGSPTNLVANGGFENGCTDWYSSSATLTPDTTGRTGPGSCRVCRNEAEAGYAVHRYFGGPSRSGDRFEASAWIRALDGTPTGSSFAIAIRALDPEESVVDRATAQAAVPTLSWQQAAVTLELTRDGTSQLAIDIGAAEGPPGSCFLVDDVTVFRR